MIPLPTQAIILDPTGAAGSALAPALEMCARHGIGSIIVLAPEHHRGRGRDGCAIEFVDAGVDSLDGDLCRLLPRLEPVFVLLEADGWLDINLLDLVVSHRAASDRLLTSAAAGRVAPKPAVRRFPHGSPHGISVVDRRLVALMREAGSPDDLLAAQEAAGRVGFVSYDRPHLRASERARPRGAIFLDRDGVVNEDCGFVCDVERFRWVEGTPLAIKAANDLGLLVFVVTNQSGVARGFFGEDAVHLVHRHIQAELRELGAHVDDFRHCPFYPQGTVAAYARESDWRKPNPGMLLDLMAHWSVDKSASIMIGDRDSDVAAGHAAGIEGYKLRDGETLAHVLECFLKPGRGLPAALPQP